MTLISVDEVMITGGLPEVGVRGDAESGDVGKRTGRALGARSVVVTSEGARGSEHSGRLRGRRALRREGEVGTRD